MNESSNESPEPTVADILAENRRRLERLEGHFDPLRGVGAPGPREWLELPDFEIPRQLVPLEMARDPWVAELKAAGSLDAWRLSRRPSPSLSELAERLRRLRCRCDFPFWAASFAMIKTKGGGPDSRFILNPPQRRLVERLEEMRLAGKPIRLVLLKARQWGGSTCIQLYIAWLQLLHSEGLNSLIIAHQGSASDEIRDMFNRMMEQYPFEMLAPLGEEPPKGRKLSAVGQARRSFHVLGRNCKIAIGTAESPDSCRGGDHSLIHLSEVGLWKQTDGKAPEDIVRSACAGVLYRPLTMIVYESTANGTGNFFHREYRAACEGTSQFRPLFISWFAIPQYSLPLEEPRSFAEELLRGRRNPNARSDREEPGSYLWWLWEQGASLEGINWYRAERAKFSDHAQMAAEYPSDDFEAFAHSGARVFDRYRIEALRPACRPPKSVGEVQGLAPNGPESLRNLHFAEDSQGALRLWEFPDFSQAVSNRYLVAVDIGGRSRKSDWSVVAVFDRLPMLSGRGPEIVAQWRGHTYMDFLAWNAARIAAFYGNALLVIESNTIETHDPARGLDGDQAPYLLQTIRDAYPNLYERPASPERIRMGQTGMYGFQTNVATKAMVISNLIQIVRDGAYVERDEECLTELSAYERRANGSFGAIAGHHDDILMTRAIGLHIAYHEMPPPRQTNRTHNSHNSHYSQNSHNSHYSQNSHNSHYSHYPQNHWSPPPDMRF